MDISGAPADNLWHYGCVDIQAAYSAAFPDNRSPMPSVKVTTARLLPATTGLLSDVVSLRKTPPQGFDMQDILPSGERLAARRLFPTLQANSGTLQTTRATNTSLQIFYDKVKN